MEDVTLPKNQGFLKWHRYTLQPGKVNEFLQEEDVTLTEKLEGVLDDTNSI